MAVRPIIQRINVNPADAVTAYLEGRDQGSGRTIRTAFHPDATLQWIAADGTPQRLEQVEWWGHLEGKDTPAAHNDQVILDREGGMALAEVTSRWATHAFHDLLILADTPEGWRVVGRVFTRALAAGILPPSTTDDERGIRDVVRVKIQAHEEYDPALLVASHLASCRYFRVHVDGEAFTHSSLSEAAARYATMRERGERDPDSQWQVLMVIQRGNIGAVKLDVIYKGVRYIDYLLMLRTVSGWMIAAAVWGDPTK